MTTICENTKKAILGAFEYNPETGHFTSKTNRGNKKIGERCGWNTPIGYRKIQFRNKRYTEHRLAFLFMTGDFPETGMHIDHINCDPSDNRWINLEAVSPRENAKRAVETRQQKI